MFFHPFIETVPLIFIYCAPSMCTPFFPKFKLQKGPPIDQNKICIVFVELFIPSRLSLYNTQKSFIGTHSLLVRPRRHPAIDEYFCRGKLPDEKATIFIRSKDIAFQSRVSFDDLAGQMRHTFGTVRMPVGINGQCFCYG